MKPIKWKEVIHRIGPNTSQAYMGKVKIGSVYYALVSKGDPSAYSFQCNLPGFSKNISSGNKPTIEEAKNRVEEIVKFWFKEVE